MPPRPPVFRPPGYRNRRERKRDADRNRGTSTQRGYDAAWREVRAQHLADPWNRLCCRCRAEGVTRQFALVDHVVPIAVDPSRRLDLTNLQSLCRAHDAEKQREDFANYGLDRGPGRYRPGEDA